MLLLGDRPIRSPALDRPSALKLGASCRVALVALAFLAGCGESPVQPGNDDAPAIALSSGAAAFSGHRGAPVPEPEIVDITNGGTGTLSALSAAVAYADDSGTGWLTATLSGTSAPATLTIEVSETGMEAGSYEASVTVTASGADGERVVDVTLELAENAPPSIEITAPARAGMLQEGTFDPSDVQITGEACHPTFPITQLEVNGAPVAVSGDNLCEPFDVVQASGWGLNIIAVHAASYGRSADVVQSFLRSPEWGPLVPAPIARGVFSQFNQPVIDDGNRTDFDDWATWVHYQITPEGLDDGLPSTLFEVSQNYLLCDYDLRITKRGFAFTSREVNLTATDDGLDAEIVLHAPRLQVRARQTGCLGNVVTRDGTFSATTLRLGVIFDVTVIEGSPIVTVRTSTVRSTGPGLNLDTTGFIDLLAQEIIDTAIPVLQELVESAGERLVRQEVVPLIEILIGSTTVDASFEIGERELAINGEADIDILEDNARIALATLVTLSGPEAEQPAALGPIFTDAGPPPPFSTTGYEAAAAVRFEVINQLLWTAWQGGAFDTDDPGAHAPSGTGISGSITSLLPPVVGPGTGDHLFEVSWGDLALELEVDVDPQGDGDGSPVAIEAFASTRLGLTLEYDDEGDRLKVSSLDAEVQLQLDSGGIPSVPEGPLLAALEEVVESVVAQQLERAFSWIPIPKLDGSDVGRARPGTVVRFEEVTVGRSGNWLTMTGTLREDG